VHARLRTFYIRCAYIKDSSYGSAFDKELKHPSWRTRVRDRLDVE
jgi:hypothetical protein